jgi:hypothetical protein
MALILGSLFLGLSVLASHLHPFPTHAETVNSQMARALFGASPFYWVIQLSTCAILVLAANTAYADFPRLSSIIARDGYLPRQFANRGDRLVFSNGIVFLAVAASVLIVVFGGIVTALIPLYAIGVFTSFTLSQTGMVRHHRRLREPGWRRGVAINGVGAVTTLVVALIVAITKFRAGAWIPIVVVPLVITLFKAIHRHYAGVGRALRVDVDDVPPPPARHTFVVLVGRVHRGTIEALQYAQSLRPDHMTALHIADEDVDHQRVRDDWARFGFTVPIEIIDSPYRELAGRSPGTSTASTHGGRPTASPSSSRSSWSASRAWPTSSTARTPSRSSSPCSSGHAPPCSRCPSTSARPRRRGPGGRPGPTLRRAVLG